MRTFHYTVVVCFLLSSCRLAGGVEAIEKSPVSGRCERVALQLSWRHKFQFAGYYMAKEKGFYRDAGFDVELREWRGGISSVRSVVLGRADFGIGQGSLNGEPIVVLASILQRSPAVIVALEGSGIRTPADLAGRRVMNGAESLAYGYRAILDANGVSPERLVLVPHGGTVDDLIEGRADACMAYATDEPYHLRKRGVPFVMFRPEDYGLDCLAEILFTSRRMASARPGRVKAFRDASLRGWAYALDHVDEAIDLILRSYAPGADRAELEFEAATFASLMEADMVEVGYVNPVRWRRMMRAQGAMPGDPTGPMTEAEIEAMLFDEFLAHPSRAWMRGLAVSLVVALGLLAISGGAALSLRHAVRRRTRALAKANAQLRLDKARLEESRLLLRLERDFAASSLLASSLRDCLDRLVALVRQIPDVDRCGVYLRSEKTGVFEMTAHRGLSVAFAMRWRSYRVEELPDYSNFRNGRNVVFTASDVPPQHREAMREEGLRCVLIVPVAVGSEVVAALHVGSGRVDAVPIAMQTALESLAIRLSGVLVHFQTQERLLASEALFRRVAESAFDAIGLIGEDGRFRFVNDRLCQTFGYRAADLEGTLFTELLSEEDVIRRMAAFRERQAGKPVPERFEMNLRRKDGAMFPAEVSVKLVRWRGEKAVVCAIQDLSERKRLEAQVLRIDELEKERIGQDLHDSVGQELVGMACILKALEHSLEEARSPHVGTAARAHENCMAAHQCLRGLVRGLLPLGSGVTLADGLRRLCENVRARGGVSCVFRDDLPSLRLSPPHAKHLYYLAMEAAANAIRHGGARNVVITLAQEDGTGVLRVDDDGSGFDLAAVSRGVGLDTMQYRANVLGGGLSVEPRADGGTTVRCVFPLQGGVMGDAS